MYERYCFQYKLQKSGFIYVNKNLQNLESDCCDSPLSS